MQCPSFHPEQGQMRPGIIIRELYMAEHIVAVYETEGAAAAAEQSLESAGIPRSVIRRYAANAFDRNEVAPTEYTTDHKSGGGF
jgi:hypothetical protein